MCGYSLEVHHRDTSMSSRSIADVFLKRSERKHWEYKGIQSSLYVISELCCKGTILPTN